MSLVESLVLVRKDFMDKAGKVQKGCVVLLFFMAGLLYLCFGQGKRSDPEADVVSLECLNNAEPTISIEMDRQEERTTEEKVPEDEKNQIVIHVCGNVNMPGVYTVKEGTRVVDAIAAAGGFHELAAVDYVNQALILNDGQQIYIPSQEEVQKGAVKELALTLPSTAFLGKVNINHATKEELLSLPGIGEAKAERIIAYRKEHNGFQTIEDILQISGIKEAVYNKVKDRITVN